MTISSNGAAESCRLSVIVSTYNRPQALNLILQALCAQEDECFEILVADDGSEQSTLDVVKAVAARFPDREIKHVWQEDKGFRLAKIRNLAVKNASGSYLIFLDGDCLPPPGFLRTHRALMEKGWAVYGQRILASHELTYDIEHGRVDALQASFWSLSSLRKQLRKNHINRIWPALSIPIGRLRKMRPNSWDKIRGCNWAMWRKDYEAINGSDESFEGWGSEDKDVAVRLLNMGVRLKSGIFCSYVLHLWHPVANRSKDHINSAEVQKRLANRTVFPIKGMY